MSIIWKSFKLGDVFLRTPPPNVGVTAKKLNIFEQPKDDTIALITRAESKNGIRGYIENNGYPTLTNAITYNDQFSFFLYHNYEFTTIKDHLSVIKGFNDELNSLLSQYDFLNVFIVKILNRVFSKKIFNFNFTGADYRYDREIILLPCLEVEQEQNYIWEENNKFYTLAIEYIKSLMSQAKANREERTINLYKTTKAELEEQQERYREEYLQQKNQIKWKKFTLDSLFVFDSSNQLSANKKALNVSDMQDNEHTIALITQTEKNNGITGYLVSDAEIESKKMINFLTYSMHFGLCYYHNYDFVLMDTHGSVFRLIPKKEGLKNLLNDNEKLNYFIAQMIKKICVNGIYNYNWLPASTRVGREIMILPCIESNDISKTVIEDGERKYTLAVEYIIYIYLQGRINSQQKLIDTYSSQY